MSIEIPALTMITAPDNTPSMFVESSIASDITLANRPPCKETTSNATSALSAAPVPAPAFSVSGSTPTTGVLPFRRDNDAESGLSLVAVAFSTLAPALEAPVSTSQPICKSARESKIWAGWHYLLELSSKHMQPGSLHVRYEAYEHIYFPAPPPVKGIYIPVGKMMILVANPPRKIYLSGRVFIMRMRRTGCMSLHALVLSKRRLW
ncbi:hypothetical protein BDQ17DRAFT_1365487 [Cyathus striatus]|nr:hypothetical protein BDQ17DRAFT_1365487 [Cyathus striatus]